MPLLGRWCPWQACGVPARPLVPLSPDRTNSALGRTVVPLGPDKPEVPVASLWCPWQACGAPGGPVVPLVGLWCPC